jgi:hypothetical protein
MTDRDQNDRLRQRPEQPRAEPEIISPDRFDQRRRSVVWMSIREQDGTGRVHLTWPGPFTIMLALAILGLIGLVMLIVLLSVALIWIPVVIALIVAFVLTVTFRQYWWRFRAWLARR